VLVPGGVAGVGRRDATGLAVQRGGEEQRLAAVAGELHDAVDRRAEAHVEHAVGLVEDEHLDAVERERPALELVLEAPRGGDDDVGAGRVATLLLEADAAVDRLDAQVARLGDEAELVDDLGGQLARRSEDQRRGALGRGIETVDQRDAEGERLAGAGGRLGEHVATVEQVREDERLDRERIGDAAAAEGSHHGLRHAEIGEGL
jgi:hypothetical protein